MTCLQHYCPIYINWQPYVLSIPNPAASAEWCFSDMKLVKNRLCNRLTELCLSNLMKSFIESPDKLTDSDLEEIVDMWNRKCRWIAV